MFGTKTDKEDVSASGQLSNRESPRPLIDASELMQLEREQKYICATATETIKLDPIRSWDVYKEPCAIPPPLRPTIIVDDNAERADYHTEIDLQPNLVGKTIPCSIDAIYRKSTRKTDEKVDKDLSNEENYWDKLGRLSE
jgi:hypothetical protein